MISIILAVLMIPDMGFSLINATIHYGNYTELINNGSAVYVGVGKSFNVTITVKSQGDINATYTVIVGEFRTGGYVKLHQGVNVISAAIPPLPNGTYASSVTMNSTVGNQSLNFRIISLTPSIIITPSTNQLYSGVPQSIRLSFINSTPIPIVLVSLNVSGINIKPTITPIRLTPPTTYSLILIPGKYGVKTTLRLSGTIIDAGGYSWGFDDVIEFVIQRTPTELNMAINSSVVNYGGGIMVTVNLYSAQVGPIPGQSVSIYIDNQMVGSIITNASGIATAVLAMNYPVGTHVVMASFRNDTYFEPASDYRIVRVNPGLVVVTVAVNSTEIIYGQSVDISVTLNPPLSNGTVTISYTSGTQNITLGTLTPVNGKVRLSWTPPQAGNYTLIATYINLPNYSPASSSTMIIVRRIPCVVNMNITGELVVLGKLDITGSLEPPLANQRMILDINGTNYEVTTGLNGLVRYTYSPPKPGEYRVTLMWLGNANYQSCSSTVNIHVSKAAVNVAVNGSASIAAMGGIVRFTVRLITDLPSDYLSGNLVLTLINLGGGEDNVTVPVVGDTMTIEVSLRKPGNYRVIITYTGNDYANPAVSSEYELEVVPGVLGIPWYLFVAYLAPVPAGYFAGRLLFRKPPRSP